MSISVGVWLLQSCSRSSHPYPRRESFYGIRPPGRLLALSLFQLFGLPVRALRQGRLIFSPSDPCTANRHCRFSLLHSRPSRVFHVHQHHRASHHFFWSLSLASRLLT